MQGVFFRAATRARAEELGLAGFIRNRPDGSVEAYFEGPAEAVEQALAFCAEGPTGARVDRIEVTEAEQENRSRFSIER